MSPRSIPRIWFFVVVLLVGAGCGEKPAAPPADGNAAPGQAAAAHAGTLDSLPGPKSVPATADAAIQAVIDGIKAGHPEALWHFLPASYQSDINAIVHDFAERMDPEIWSRTGAALGKLARVIKAQRKFVAAMMPGPAKGAGAPESPQFDIEGLTSLLETLVQSELGDLEKLKQADVGRILAVTGGQLLTQIQALSKFSTPDQNALQINDFSKLKVSLVSSEGDTAIVRVEAPGDDPRELEFVRVEGKWIPNDLATSWVEVIGEARARLSLVSKENLAAKKPQWLTLVATIENVLDQMAAARDQEQFAAAAQSLFIPGMLAATMFAEPEEAAPADAADPADGADAETPPAGEADLVTVVVRGKISSAAQDALLEKLKSSTGAKDQAFAEFVGDDEMTSYKIGPVSDVEAFAGQLEFLKVVEVDARKRLITATPGE
jgi:hypothetical protein